MHNETAIGKSLKIVNSGTGTGGQGGSCPPALLLGGARGEVLLFAFLYDSNEANAC